MYNRDKNLQIPRTKHERVRPPRPDFALVPGPAAVVRARKARGLEITERLQERRQRAVLREAPLENEALDVLPVARCGQELHLRAFYIKLDVRHARLQQFVETCGRHGEALAFIIVRHVLDGVPPRVRRDDERNVLIIRYRRLDELDVGMVFPGTERRSTARARRL